METKQLTERNPELLRDVNLFKLVLMPIELYVLKFFFVAGRPANIREVYTTAIEVLFNYTFNEQGAKGTFMELYKNQIYGSGYGYAIVGQKEKEKILKEYVSQIKGRSETQIRNLQTDILKDIGMKFPSYDKFKNIFEKFEILGVLVKIGKEGKGISYTLNPKFYNSFKDKIEEIKQL